MRIGVAGLGAMGSAIAARLIEVGHDVTVWNRSVDKTEALAAAGATVAASPAALADVADVIITILTDADAIDAVYNRANGLLFGDVKGKMLIEMSTVAPQVETDLAPKVRGKGAAFVECPVGGSKGPARQGKLLGLMGAEPADAERARPVLQQLCRKVEHCGPVGAGSAMKLAINLPLMVAWQAYGEAFAIARQVGMEPKRLVELFAESNGANNGFKTRVDMITAMLEGRDPGPANFSIDNARKDLRTMIEAGHAAGADMIAAQAALTGFDDAAAHGQGEGDGARLSVYWSERKAP